MSNTNQSGATDRSLEDEDIAPEYDFSGGERGKHAKAMPPDFGVVIHRADGSDLTMTAKIVPSPGVVVLDPDVRKYFPDSEAVNLALRALIDVASRLSRQQPTPVDKTPTNQPESADAGNE